MRKLLLCMFLASFVALLNAQTEVNLNDALPLDSNIRYGKLDNGLSYYVLHNEEPKDRASFYIVQNVGAILENDEQNGLAHFLEHMAFNGTEHFPQKGILEYLESYGVAFGRNINAYTSLDETVYNLSNVPVDNENLIDSTLLVLHDWSNYLSLTNEEIDNERGVIREESRTRRSQGGYRVYIETRKYLFEGSKYVKRDVLGDINVIDTFNYQAIRNFYHDYYRTDLQAIIVVGDIDADSIEKKIMDRFSTIPAVEDPKPREYFAVPENEEPIVGVVTDPEEGSIRFSAYFKHKSTPFAEKNLGYYRSSVLNALYSDMLGMRYNELVQTGTPPFIYAYAAYYNNVRLMDVYTVGGSLNENNILGGIEATMTENERVLRHGFTKTELERAKVSMLSNYESAYKERNKRNSDKLVRELQNHYLKNEPVPGIAYEYELIQKLLPEISVEEINALAKKWNTKENLVVTLSGPKKDSLIYPSKKQILGVLAKVKQLKIDAYFDKVSNEALITEMPKPGKALIEKQLIDFNAVEWELENGAKVVVKNTDFKDDEIVLKVYSKGGSSLFGVDDLASANMTENFIGSFGLGKFDKISLEKKLTGKVVSLSPFLGKMHEGFNGSSNIDDFEVMLQLLYMYFEEPRFDEDAFNALKSRYMAYVANMNTDINKAFNDSLSLIVTNYHERTLLFNTKMIEKLDFAKMERIYKDRFVDASDFTFVFVGNIKAEEAKPLVEMYIGGIKSTKREETWKDNKVNYPKKDTYKAFAKDMETPKTTIYIKMHGDGLEYNAENRIYMNVVAKLLDKRYLEVIREEEGGTYGVRVSGSVSKYPTEQFGLTIKFDTDPEKAEKLKGMVYAEIDKLQNEAINSAELEEAKKNLIKVREEGLRKNTYWINALMHYYQYDETVVLPAAFEDIVVDISPEKVQEFAKTYLPKTGKIEVVMSPLEK
ncbi:MAG: insulinase family protein [Salinivirgaceae bacterium]|nr:insulinase family protein [Salinivirgaceae bacterium]